ncbi:MAG: protease modulator HflK, partial [Alphaproteobacteria bacterium]|nr:protease modulator HflK [Alphaproteobacteria bacterium]
MTGNDDNRENRRNPWGQSGNHNQGPWGQRPNPSNNDEGPDFEALFRQARGIFGNGGNDVRLGLIAVLLVIGAWLASGVYRVDPGENAVVQRFGAIARTQATPGLGYRLPWPIETVTKLNVMLDRRTTVGLADSSMGSQKRDLPEESLMLTADANIVDIDVVVLWNVLEAEKFLFSIRNPEQTIKRVAESAIREAVGQTRLQSIITEGRDDVAVKIQKSMQSMLDFYKSGVSVKQVLIQEATVHPEVIAAYN